MHHYPQRLVGTPGTRGQTGRNQKPLIAGVYTGPTGLEQCPTGWGTSPLDFFWGGFGGRRSPFGCQTSTTSGSGRDLDCACGWSFGGPQWSSSKGQPRFWAGPCPDPAGNSIPAEALLSLSVNVAFGTLRGSRFSGPCCIPLELCRHVGFCSCSSLPLFASCPGVLKRPSLAGTPRDALSMGWNKMLSVYSSQRYACCDLCLIFPTTSPPIEGIRLLCAEASTLQFL
jgi:hypothetical protein